MLSQAQTMENKNLLHTELELTKKLLEVVNSKEEFDYLLGEEKRLSFFFSKQELLLNQVNKLGEI